MNRAIQHLKHSFLEVPQQLRYIQLNSDSTQSEICWLFWIQILDFFKKNCNILTLVFIYGKSNCSNIKIGKGPEFPSPDQLHIASSMRIVWFGNDLCIMQTRNSSVYPQPRKAELLTLSLCVPGDISTYRWKTHLKTQYCDNLAQGRPVPNYHWAWIEVKFVRKRCLLLFWNVCVGLLMLGTMIGF